MSEEVKTLPALDHLSRSWICTSPKGEVLELRFRQNAMRCLEAGWRVELAAEYLARLNREARS